MSQIGSFFPGGGGGGSPVETITGNSGGAVGPNGAFNINIVGSGTISVVGNPGTNTLTISDSAAGTITSVLGTANEITSTNSGGPIVTLSIPAVFIAPGSVAVTSGFTVDAGAVTIDPFTTAGMVENSAAGILSTFATTNHAVQVGNATGQLTSLALATDAQVLLGVTGADPIFATLTSSDGSVTFTPGAGTLSIQAAGGGGVPSIIGTANQITETGSPGATTLSTPVVFIAPGSIEAVSTVQADTNFLMVTTTSTAGQIIQNGTPVFQTYGTGNLFLGPSGGNFSLTGSYNTGVGSQSVLSNLTTGIRNTVFGSNAGVDITSGGENVGLGFAVFAGGGNITGTANIGIGYSTFGFGNLTSASYNVAIGYTALHLLVDGSGNIAIGSYGAGGGPFVGDQYSGTESNNILFNATGVTGESNVCRIGDSTGLGSFQLNSVYVQGVYGNSPVTPQMVTIDSTGYLGSQTIPVGNVGTINSITADSGPAQTGPGVALVGTANQVSVISSGAGPTITFSTPVVFIAPGSSASTTTMGVGTNLLMTTTSSTSGIVYRNSVAWEHAYGTDNIWIGNTAGNFTLTGTQNVAVGSNTGHDTTTASNNVLIGFNAGAAVTTSDQNVLIGSGAGASLILNRGTYIGYNAGTLDTGTGSGNLGIGRLALSSYTGSVAGQNTMVGQQAGSNIVSGQYNTFLGNDTGLNYTGAESSNILIGCEVEGTLGESNHIRIGKQGAGIQEQNTCFISGITGGAGTALTVFVDATGLLGTTVSSRRYKTNIAPLVTTEALYNLNPVSFNYIDPKRDQRTQVGLIAEEVHEVMPSLVVYENGQPENVRYHELPILLLNELKKLAARVQELELKLGLKG